MAFVTGTMAVEEAGGADTICFACFTRTVFLHGTSGRAPER